MEIDLEPALKGDQLGEMGHSTQHREQAKDGSGKGGHSIPRLSEKGLRGTESETGKHCG